jgi:hypothetical protein
VREGERGRRRKDSSLCVEASNASKWLPSLPLKTKECQLLVIHT